MTRILLALFVFILSAPVQAQEDVATFFKGKTLRIVVGSGVGSGYDITARTLARHMGAHIPGNPTVIVQNQPGAGGAIMTNSLRNGPFDRHGDRRAVQRHADHAAVVAAKRAVRRREAQLYRQHQPRNPGDVCLVHGAVADARRRQDRRAGDGRAGAPAATQYDYPVLLDRLPITNSRSSPVTRARRRFIWRWSAAKCRAPSPTGRR